ncbi:hypothetical protein BDV96DRAFT_482018 [Lophiotrema nucula]|uniref:DUF1993 domain-containing protein n=1 Tax=Lophiotrema nucula TaxID=690887 RepID=A0A6A5ZUL7_9PLEO|nr:hypothetical protein BDV96DRAFT_482018 [Lophiotrema nucula]
MSLTFYNIAIPPLVTGLSNLRAFLKKAEDHAKSNSIDPQEYLDARLYEDMGALTYQIYRLSDTARFIAVRCAGVEPVSMPDDQKTFEELYGRIDATIEYLEKVDAKAFEDQEGREVTLKFGKGLGAKFTAIEYLTKFGIPNFWFHVTTAYDILRSKGVPLGKMVKHDQACPISFR